MNAPPPRAIRLAPSASTGPKGDGKRTFPNMPSRFMPELDAAAPAKSRPLRRRRVILDAAAEVFARKGYHAATTRDIADRLGMQPGSLYYYFESKEAALEEVCRIGGIEFGDNLENILASGDPAPDMIRAAVAKHLRGDRRHYVSCFVHDRRYLPETVLPEMNRLARRYMKAWEDVIRRGIDRGELLPDLDPRIAATAAVALCNGASAHLEGKTPQRGRAQ
jgi:AcrR family transcriptional regulator